MFLALRIGNDKARNLVATAEWLLGGHSRVAVWEEVAAVAQIGRGIKLSVFIGAIALVAGAFIAPAWANHKPGHTQGGSSSSSDNDGDADSDPGTTYTEDNDTNDGGTPNNQSDDGDNAHPSGKDRSVEHGKSGTQGKAESDPDNNGKGPDRENGGPDKANGSGGTDLADQDGNNGCGNDDDFEDDNEGWCGPHENGGPNNPPNPSTEKTPPGDEVLPGGEKRPNPESTVEGLVLERSPAVAAGAAGKELPFTGADLDPYIAAGLIFILGGLLLLRALRV
jgi:hypothetical protein